MWIRLQEVTKLYQGSPALVSVNAQITAGEIILLVGPNGAGKSTMLRLLAGVTAPTTGRVLGSGGEAGSREYRDLLGYLPQRPRFYEHLTPVQWLEYLARLKALPPRLVPLRIAALVDDLGLQSAADEQIGRLSSGVRQRLSIASAFLNDPELVLLDEPLTNLDLDASLTVIDWISTQVEGKACIIASHLLSPFENLAQRLWLVQEGVLKADVALSTALEELQGKIWQLQLPAPRSSPPGDHPLICRHLGDECEWRVFSRTRPPGAVTTAPTLTDLYVLLVGGHGRRSCPWGVRRKKAGFRE